MVFPTAAPDGPVTRWYAWVIALLTGGFLATATYFPSAVLGAFVAVALVPLLLVTERVPEERLSKVGLVFFAAWILPTTAWYYSFMPLWLAPLASIGMVMLLSNLFHVLRLRRLSFGMSLFAFTAAYLGWQWLHFTLPVLRDWWIPHYGYAVWQNPLFLTAAPLGGELAVEAAVLAANVVIAYAVRSALRVKESTPHRWLYAAPLLVIIVIVGVLAVVGTSAPDTGNRQPIVAFAAVQQRTGGGVDVPADDADLDRLSATTRRLKTEARPGLPLVVVWPENKLTESLAERAKSLAASEQIFLLVHTVVPVEGKDPVKRAVLYGPDGHEVVANTKVHIAPGEKGTSAWSANAVALPGTHLKITTYICYDMHYRDTAGRIGDADIVLVPLNDSDFAHLQRTFHLADLAIRAAQTGAGVIAASTDGPTAIIDSDGRVTQRLPYDVDAELLTARR